MWNRFPPRFDFSENFGFWRNRGTEKENSWSGEEEKTENEKEENIWRRKIFGAEKRKRKYLEKENILFAEEEKSGRICDPIEQKYFFVSFPTNGLPSLVPRVIILALHCRVCKLSRLHCVPDFCALLSLKDKASPFEKILMTNYHRSLLAQSRLKKEDCPPNQT